MKLLKDTFDLDAIGLNAVEDVEYATGKRPKKAPATRLDVVP
jgi:hypothetical protein